MKNLVTTLSLLLIGILISPELLACGSTTVTGPTACGTATVPFGTPVTYTANTTTSSSACTVFEWRITGGVESTTLSPSVNIFETLGCATSNCLIGPGIPCLPGTSSTTSSIGIIWTAGVPERSVSVRVRELGTIEISSSGSLLIDRVTAPSSITQVSKNCSGGTYRANMPATNCAQAGFDWFLNGSFIGSTTSNTRSISVGNLQGSFTVGAEAVFDGRNSSRTNRTFPALVQNTIVGPSLICAGSDNQFNMLTYPGVTPSSIQWLSSSTQVTVGSPTSAQTAVFVGGSPPSSFQLSCTTVTCGITNVDIRTISIGTPGAGSCPPIPREDGGVSSMVMEDMDEAQGTALTTMTRAEEKQTEIDASVPLSNNQQTESTIFPNPVKLGGSVFLPLDCMETESTQVEILDAMGKRVYAEQRADAYQQELSTNQIKSPGHYVLRVSNDCGSKVYRLLIVK